MSKTSANAPPVAGAPKLTSADLLHRDLSTATIAFHDAAARHLGMNAAEHKVFGVLADLAIATPGQLARASGFTTGAITGIVDRLERAGYVSREPNPADRRSILVRPLQLEKFRREHPPVFASLTRAMAELRADYTAEQLEVIHNYLAKTTQILQQETAKLGRAQAGSRRSNTPG
jgi:DNA-binding MarR family transcriptional regulator